MGAALFGLSPIAAEPVSRTVTPFSGVSRRSPASRRSSVITFAAGLREAKSSAGWMTTTRRLERVLSSSFLPAISSCQDRCRNSPAVCALTTSVMASSTLTISIGCVPFSFSTSSIARPSILNRPTKLGSRHSVPRNGCAAASLSLSSMRSALSRYRNPCLRKNSLPSGSNTAPNSFGLAVSFAVSARAASSARSGVWPSMTTTMLLESFGNAFDNAIAFLRNGSSGDSMLSVSVEMRTLKAR